MESPDCQVQIQNQAGQFYMGFSVNATAMVFGDGTSVVSLFATTADWPYGVEMDVSAGMECVDYCPNEFPLEPYNVLNYTDKGPVNINGTVTEQWQQIQCLGEHCYLNITVEIDNIFVDQADFANAFPVVENLLLTPFNEYLGTVNTTFTNWISGTPNTKYFNVSGVASCPQANNCNSNVRQMARLAGHQFQAYNHWARVGRAHAQERAAKAVLARAAGRAVERV